MEFILRIAFGRDEEAFDILWDHMEPEEKRALERMMAKFGVDEVTAASMVMREGMHLYDPDFDLKVRRKK